MAENNFFKNNAEILVWIGLAGPSLFILFNLEESGWPVWVAYAVAAVGGWFFKDGFISRSMVREVKKQQVGPKEEFVPPNAERWEFDINPQTGEPYPIKRVNIPTNRNSNQPPQYTPYQRGR